MKNVRQPGVIADSVPAAEMAAYQNGAKDIVWCRQLAEDFANLVPAGCTDLVVKNSASPTETYIDNLSVQSLVSGENGKGKALRFYNRVISHLRSLKTAKITDPIGIPTAEQETDIGTKQYKNATAYWRSAVGPLGVHPAIAAMQERVAVRNGRGARERKHQGEHGVVQDVDEEEEPIKTAIDGKAILNVACANLSITAEEEDIFAEERLGQLTMENTRLNKERDSDNRRWI